MRARLPWLLWAACVVLTLAGLGLLVLNGDTRPIGSLGPPPLTGTLALLALAFPTVGAIVATRSGNVIGWLFLGAGLATSVGRSLLGYATYTMARSPGTLPGGSLAGLVAEAVSFPAIAAAVLLLFVLFPTGRLTSARWRWYCWAVAANVSAIAVVTLLNPALLRAPYAANPLDLPPAIPFLRPVRDVAGSVLIVLLVLGVVALTFRYRRSAGVERLQIRWLFYAGALWLAALPASVALGDAGISVDGVPVADLAWSFLLPTIPAAVGIAILRHRLYDIDVVINRTLVYGALTVTLGVAYLGSVLLLQLVLNPLTQGSGLAVAGSTLAVAALFRPARARIQATVDRRFYRRRYDATLTLEAFGLRLRNELDLESLATGLRGVAHETMQPAHVSLWLRRADR